MTHASFEMPTTVDRAASLTTRPSRAAVHKRSCPPPSVFSLQPWHASCLSLLAPLESERGSASGPLSVGMPDPRPDLAGDRWIFEGATPPVERKLGRRCKAGEGEEAQEKERERGRSKGRRARCRKARRRQGRAEGSAPERHPVRTKLLGRRLLEADGLTAPGTWALQTPQPSTSVERPSSSARGAKLGEQGSKDKAG